MVIIVTLIAILSGILTFIGAIMFGAYIMKAFANWKPKEKDDEQ